MSERVELVELTDVIRQVMKKMATQWSKVADYGLSLSQTSMLEKLASEGPQKASHLAEALNITTGGITGIADKLIAGGLVERKRDDEDRRIVYLAITPLGRSTLKRAIRQRERFIETCFSQLTESELQSLVQIYKKILSTLEQS